MRRNELFLVQETLFLILIVQISQVHFWYELINDSMYSLLSKAATILFKDDYQMNKFVSYRGCRQSSSFQFFFHALDSYLLVMFPNLTQPLK